MGKVVVVFNLSRTATEDIKRKLEPYIERAGCRSIYTTNPDIIFENPERKKTRTCSVVLVRAGKKVSEREMTLLEKILHHNKVLLFTTPRWPSGEYRPEGIYNLILKSRELLKFMSVLECA